MLHLETRLGAMINMSLVRELGPVLAATMLAGRVGSAMAAELGTMRVTEQIDALASMGANPIHYLVVPRFLACLLLIPDADDHGRLHGRRRRRVLQHRTAGHRLASLLGELAGLRRQRSTCSPGVFKSLFFGAAIALISCYRGFHCEPGAEGVGRAATAAFVFSFVVILVLDFFLGIGLDGVYLTDLARRAATVLVEQCRSTHADVDDMASNRIAADIADAADRAASGRRRSSAGSACCATSTWRFRAGRRWRSSAKAAAARPCC